MNDLARAVAAIVTDPGGRVLLVLQNYGQYRWCLPGDRVGAEAPDAAVCRQVHDETGIETRVVDLVGLYHLPGGAVELPDLLTYVFRLQPVRGEPAVRWPARTSRLGWHPPNRVPTPATALTCAALGDAAAGRSGVVRHLL